MIRSKANSSSFETNLSDGRAHESMSRIRQIKQRKGFVRSVGAILVAIGFILIVEDQFFNIPDSMNQQNDEQVIKFQSDPSLSFENTIVDESSYSSGSLKIIDENNDVSSPPTVASKMIHESKNKSSPPTAATKKILESKNVSSPPTEAPRKDSKSKGVSSSPTVAPKKAPKSKKASSSPTEAPKKAPKSKNVSSPPTKLSKKIIESKKNESLEEPNKKLNPFLNVDDPKDHGTIKSVNILGERNSGTTWMYEHLNECFNHSIPVRRRLKRYKHWFQDENIPTENIVNGTLVVAIFRNVFDWTRAMMATPHNAPMHIDLSWKEFVTKKWTMERFGFDLNVTEEQKKDPLFCQQGFFYKDVVTCHHRPYPKGYFKKRRFSEDKPIYEMRPDGSGKPFNNILEMRAAKIHNTLTTKNFKGVQDLWLLKYEDLLEYGTKEIVQKIELMTGLKAKCTSSPPQKRKKRGIPKEMSDHLKKEVDWDAEKLIGYYK